MEVPEQEEEGEKQEAIYRLHPIRSREHLTSFGREKRNHCCNGLQQPRKQWKSQSAEGAEVVEAHLKFPHNVDKVSVLLSQEGQLFQF